MYFQVPGRWWVNFALSKGKMSVSDPLLKKLKGTQRPTSGTFLRLSITNPVAWQCIPPEQWPLSDCDYNYK